MLFSVWPLSSNYSLRYQYLTDIISDYTKEELKGANISVLVGRVNVGHLDTKKILSELYK